MSLWKAFQPPIQRRLALVNGALRAFRNALVSR